MLSTRRFANHWLRGCSVVRVAHRARPCASLVSPRQRLLPLLRDESSCNQLLALAEADPRLAAVLAQSEPADASEEEDSDEGLAAQPLTSKQLMVAFVNTLIPFLGFGFFDNFLMIIAGDALDTTLCVTLGYTTMVAAALGNTLSDQAGLVIGGLIETIAEKSGLPPDESSSAQRRTLPWKLAHHGGSVFGITVGCFLGMVPLGFIGQKGEVLRAEKAMEEDLAKMVEQKLAKLVDADRASLFVVNEETGKLETKVAKDVNSDARTKIEVPLDGESLVATCYQKRKCVKKDNMPESASKFGYIMKSVMCLPVYGSHGEVIGVLQMLNKMTGDSFTSADEQLGTRYATMLAFVLQGARSRSMGSCDSLNDLLEQQHSIRQQQIQAEMFEAVVNELSELLSADRSSLWLKDSDAGDLFTVVSQGMDPIRCSPDKGLVGYVARSCQPLNLLDAYGCEHFNSDVDDKTGYRTGSALVMPVSVTAGEVVGVIQALNKKGAAQFTKEDEELVAAFAIHIGITLDGMTRTFTDMARDVKTTQHAQLKALIKG
mmetsp:Transcript_154861/g.288767  ORF Transcript_154861/g.288767 Transcript_154861/m.288767 type:complete len:545 (-) Transcript_154861:91-1725(-)